MFTQNIAQQGGLRNNMSEEVAPQMVEPSCNLGSLDDGLPPANLHVYKKSCFSRASKAVQNGSV